DTVLNEVAAANTGEPYAVYVGDAKATSSFDILDDAPAARAGADPLFAGGEPPTDGPAVDGGRMPARKGRRKGLYVLLALVVVVLLVGGGLAWKFLVMDRKDYSSTTGERPALVQIPDNAPVREAGDILTDAGVVGSQKAFVNAAGDSAISAGFYKLPTHISAATAVKLMQGNGNRVGRAVIPEGAQLDSKKGADGNTRKGVFEMLADATRVEADGKTYGVTVEQLQKAAATSTPEELGVPAWAKAPVAKLNGDHRRIEGLIASGAWESLDPRMDAKSLLKYLISQSATRFESWGLLGSNESGLLPYDTLIVASIVEAETKHPEDAPKVARVILNRLAKDQKLEMDSTVNYTADINDIDVHGEAYRDANAWNTYQHDGLPVTPIGSIGQMALQSVEHPAQGKWLYFVTVDKHGTTLFADNFEKHKRNREVACKNKLLTVGC
ncbi:MAG: endolytic transglycosylase MltG, partial [Gordonia sp. (in: high G+C Gram-positive bacteria)]